MSRFTQGFLVISLVLIVGAGLTPAWATDVCGPVCDVTWIVADSPYVVTCDVTVAAGCSLTVEAGAAVRFQAATGLFVDGTLDVSGTAGAPATFTSASSTPQSSDWNGILFRGNSTGTIRRGEITYAEYGVKVEERATVDLEYVTARYNRDGIYVYGGLASDPGDIRTVTATNCTFTNNSSTGVRVYAAYRGTTSVTIANSSVHSNQSPICDVSARGESQGDDDVYLDVVNMRGNWWGTTDPTVIGDRLYEARSLKQALTVDFCDWLDAPGGSPVRNVHCPDLAVCDGETHVWDQTDLPYLLTSSVHVCDTGTLQVGPGVEVRAVPMTDSLGIWAYDGNLEINGTPESRVTMTSDGADPQPRDWGGVGAFYSATADIQNATIEYGWCGVQAHLGAFASLDGVIARRNTYGLNVGRDTTAFVDATGCQFVDNDEYGVMISHTPEWTPTALTIRDSEIHSNHGLYDYFADHYPAPGETFLDAQHNWWGTTDAHQIASRIHDHADDPLSPMLAWCQYLDGPGGTPRDVLCPETEICGETELLDDTSRPYLVTSDIHICPTGTLQIAAGVEVRVAAGSPGLAVINEGNLDVDGTAVLPATFLSDAAVPQAGDWTGLQLVSNSASTIDHAEIRHAVRAVHLYDTSSAILNEAALHQNTDGLFLYGSIEATASGCTFTGNERYGVYAQGAPTLLDPVVTVSDSEIHSNGPSYDFYLDGGFSAPQDTILMARNNWWGSATPDAIARRIYDRTDSTSNAVVDWCRYLDGPGGTSRATNCVDPSICNEVVVLDRTDAPYLVTADIEICPTGTLQIGPGVEVRFAEMSPTVGVRVEGTLDVNGTEGSPVLLTSDAETPAPEDWQGLYLTTGSSNHVEHATVDHASNAIHVNGTSATLDHVETTDSARGVYVYGNSTVDINALTSRFNNDGLYVYHGNSTVTVTGSTLTDNNRYGVYLDGYSGTLAPQVSITGSSIHSNLGAYDVWTHRYSSPGQQVIVARDNWWGTPDTTAISSRIHDYREITSSPLVDFCGWLDGAGGAPVRDAECPDLAICGETADWTVTTRPYLLTSDLRICSTGTLNVGPGVEVRSALTSPTLDFVNYGILDVSGTAGDEVRFTSDADSPAAADWSGLYSYSGSSNTIEHATIDHATSAIYVNDTSATLDHVETTDSTRGVYVYGNATVNINALTSRLNNDGLLVYHGNSTVTVTGSALTDNNRYGVNLDGYSGTLAPQVTVTGSSIHSNLGSYDFYTYRYANPGQQVIVAQGNWWGTPDATAISSRIHDYRQLSSSPLVDFCGWLDGAGGAAVRDAECPDLAICEETADWTVTARPYLLTGDLRICPTGTLNVGPGVEVRSAVTSPTLDFVNHGILNVSGMAGNEVRFTSDADSPAVGDWSGLYSYSGAGSTIEYATIDHASNAIQVNDTSATLDHVETTDSTRGVYIYGNSTVDINALTSRLNTDGLYVYHGNSTVTVTGSELTDNSRYGVNLDGYSGTLAPQVTITGSSIHSNLGTYDLYTYRYINPGRQVIVAQDNWWGTPDATAISSRIHDYRQLPSSPLVDFCGWLDSAGGAPVRDAECPDLAICEETVDWASTARPYLLTSDLRICSTGTLNVGPGVEVRSALTSPTLDFVNYGILDVNGTMGDEVRFTSDADAPAAADWSGLYSYSGSSSTIEHATIDHAASAVYVNDTSATLDHVETTDSTRGVYVYGNATVDIDALTSRLNNDGLLVYHGNSTVTVTGSTLTDNSRYGVYLDGYSGTLAPQVSITGSSIHSNLGSYDLYTYRYLNPGRQVIVAQGNWWGTPDATAISSRIHDYRQLSSSPLVDFCGWLDGAGGGAVRDTECPDLAVCGETADWTVTTRPYLLTSDLRICSTGTLNVGPGVEVRSALTSPTLDFVNYGILNVSGTAGDEVHFTSDADAPAAADWSGLYSYSGSSSTIEHATIDHASNAVYVDATSATLDHVETTDSTRGVYVYGNATVDIDALTSRLNNDGLLVYHGNSTVTVTGSTLTDNSRYGVYLDGYSGTLAPQVSITGSSIHSNLGSYDLYTYRYDNPATTIVWATDNWWGTSDPVAIETRIYDHDDLTSSPHVYYQAFGDLCDMALGRDGDRDGLADFEDNCPDLSNRFQSDSDADGMGDACDPEPATTPWGVCDGFEDILDGYLDSDGDGWGDPCDHQPMRTDSYPGAPELCDGRDNDGDGLLAVDEQVDDDMDEGLACGDCDDLEPLANVCMCEMCDNLIDDDCDLAMDGGDSECQDYATCVVLASGPDPGLTMHKGECGGATISGPFDVIRGSLVQLQIASGSVDLGSVECVEGGLDWGRVTEWSPAPRPLCEEVPVLYFLARNAGDLDFGLASGGEPREIMDPDPPCP